MLDGHRIHSVDGSGGNAIDARLRRHVCLRERAIDTRAHGVQIVLADEEHWQLPERGKIQRLVELPFRHGAIAEETRRHPLATGHRIGERESDRNRQPPADNRVASVEAGRGIEDVHRAAPPTAAALLLPVHLGHQPAGVDPARQRVAMLAIGGDDGVFCRQRTHATGGDSFLPDVEVQESPDLPRAVQLGTLLLEPPNAEHVTQERESQFAIERRRWCGRAHVASSVEVSPSGRPSSRARNTRRAILPERVYGNEVTKSISFGATAAPRCRRA